MDPRNPNLEDRIAAALAQPRARSPFKLRPRRCSFSLSPTSKKEDIPDLSHIDQLYECVLAGNIAQALEVARADIELQLFTLAPAKQRINILNALNTQLLQAAAEGDLEQTDQITRTLLCLTDSVTVVTPAGETLLHIAAQHNQPEIADYWLKIMQTAEIHRVCKRNPQAMESILASDNIHQAYKAIKETVKPLILKSKRFKRYYLRKIITELKDMQGINTYGGKLYTELEYKINALKQLHPSDTWNKIQDVSKQLKTGNHSLFERAYARFLQIPIQDELCGVDTQETSPLMHAAQHGATQSARVIFKYIRALGASTATFANASDRAEGMTPYLLAAEKGHTETMALLARYGAHTTAINKWGQNAADLLSMHHSPDDEDDNPSSEE